MGDGAHANYTKNILKISQRNSNFKSCNLLEICQILTVTQELIKLVFENNFPGKLVTRTLNKLLNLSGLELLSPVISLGLTRTMAFTSCSTKMS